MRQHALRRVMVLSLGVMWGCAQAEGEAKTPVSLWELLHDSDDPSFLFAPAVQFSKSNDGGITEIQKLTLSYYGSANCGASFLGAHTTTDTSQPFPLTKDKPFSLNSQAAYKDAQAAGITTPGASLVGSVLVTFSGVNGVDKADFSVATCNLNGDCCVPISCDDGAGTCASATLTTPQAFTYNTATLGASGGGGKVACLTPGGVKNLIAATADNSGGIPWDSSDECIFNGNCTSVPGAYDNSNGSTNTAAIVATLSGQPGVGATNYAAGLCDAYEVDIQGHSPCQAGNVCYNDWYLPAKDELDCLYQNRAAVGGFDSYYYWSSTELVADLAWVQNFGGGSQDIGNKYASDLVRCVRAITP